MKPPEPPRPHLPTWLTLVIGGAICYGILLASWAGETSLIWLGLVTLFLVGEAHTLLNERPGDTLSGHLWRWLKGGRVRIALFLALVLWLLWHLLLQPWMPN